MSQFTDKQEFNIPRHIVQKGGVNIEALTASRTLTYLDSQYQRLDNTSGGSVDVILPEEKNGAMFVINCQGYTFTVKDAAGTTVKTLSVGEGCMVCCNGTVWKQFI